MKSAYFILLFLLMSVSLFAQQHTEDDPLLSYTCWPSCSEWDGPAYVVWAEVEVLGFCYSFESYTADAWAFAACSISPHLAYAFGEGGSQPLWQGGAIGWVKANAGFADGGDGWDIKWCDGLYDYTPPWIEEPC